MEVIQEYVVRIPESNKKKYNVMRFNTSLNVDVKQWTQAKLERENNIKEFKMEEDLPKYGAGSEYGREQREEARRKKYGIITKKYKPEDQPWLLEVGGRGGKKFKGVREGGVAENTSYYVFMQSPDGVFEAYPVKEWYNFTPIQRYKALSAEEAEEQYNKRDKVLNYFSLMSRKRLKNEEDGDEENETKNQAKNKSKNKDLKISDMDEWITDSEDEELEEGDNEKESNKQKKKEPVPEKKKKKEQASDEEAVEESDEGDFDDREVDYISNSSSDSEEEPEEEKVNREMKGVEDEEALRKLDLSEEEEETEEKGTAETEEQPTEEKPVAKEKVKAKKADANSSGDSTSESDDSDFDDSKFHSAMFMQRRKNGSDNSASSSRANTPTKMQEGKKSSHKRKLNSSDSHPEKKIRMDSQPGTPTSSSSDGITEDSVRRYLMRKPMTTTELLQKFKSKKTGLSSDQLVTTIAQILKRLNPEKQKIKGKLYLSIKQ